MWLDPNFDNKLVSQRTNQRLKKKSEQLRQLNETSVLTEKGNDIKKLMIT